MTPIKPLDYICNVIGLGLLILSCWIIVVGGQEVLGSIVELIR